MNAVGARWLARPLLVAAALAVSLHGVAVGQVPTAPAEPGAGVAAASLSERVAERIRREAEAQGLVGVSVAVTRGEAVVLTSHFGHENREARVEAGDATMYRWASVSKPMTAVAAMQLAKAGKLELDADVRRYVPEFPEKPFKITARQLLTHQGGIVHYSNGPVVTTRGTYRMAHPFEDVVVALDAFKESPLVCEPGEKHSYSTHGYMLLGAVVQRAGLAAFAEQVRERIARPLGMETLRPDYQWERIGHRAVGYRKDGEGKTVRTTDTDVSWKLAGGGWISTVGDMARFGGGMLGDRLVDGETRAAMWTDQKDRAGKATGYGLGFGVRQRDGKLVVSHSGAQEKTATMLLIRPEESGVGEGGGTPGPTRGIVVAVMCNTEEAGLATLAWDLSEIVLGRAARGEGKDAGTK